MVDALIPAEVFPPGDFIKDELEARGWTQSDLAAILDRPIGAVTRSLRARRPSLLRLLRGWGLRLESIPLLVEMYGSRLLMRP